jgi:hypothetical protein
MRVALGGSVSRSGLASHPTGSLIRLRDVARRTCCLHMPTRSAGITPLIPAVSPSSQTPTSAPPTRCSLLTPNPSSTAHRPPRSTAARPESSSTAHSRRRPWQTSRRPERPRACDRSPRGGTRTCDHPSPRSPHGPCPSAASERPGTCWKKNSDRSPHQLANVNGRPSCSAEYSAIRTTRSVLFAIRRQVSGRGRERRELPCNKRF